MALFLTALLRATPSLIKKLPSAARRPALPHQQARFACQYDMSVVDQRNLRRGTHADSSAVEETPRRFPF
jgi:hypothetical protein